MKKYFKLIIVFSFIVLLSACSNKINPQEYSCENTKEIEEDNYKKVVNSTFDVVSDKDNNILSIRFLTKDNYEKEKLKEDDIKKATKSFRIVEELYKKSDAISFSFDISKDYVLADFFFDYKKMDENQKEEAFELLIGNDQILKGEEFRKELERISYTCK